MKFSVGISDVGLLTPGVLETVFALCCATCARVELVPYDLDFAVPDSAPTGGGFRHRVINRTLAAKYAFGLGWRVVRGDDIDGSVWQCPGCRPPKLPGFGP